MYFKQKQLRIFKDTETAEHAKPKGSIANASTCLQLSDESTCHMSGVQPHAIELVPAPGQKSIFLAAHDAETQTFWLGVLSRVCGGSSSSSGDNALRKTLSRKGSALFAQAHA